jgi:hypothetical protein
MAVNGKEIPGYTLVRGSKQRKWIDEDSIISEFSSELGDAIYTRKLLSPAQMEKLVGKDRVADYIIKPEGELKLVMETEVADGIKRTVEEAFKDVVID